MEEKKDYQDAYEKEHYKAVYLANRVAELEDQVDDLQFKLNRIKNNPIWKASGPARKCMHFVIRQKDRLKNCGSLSGVIAKVRYKSWEKKAMTHYGTQSFPSAEERQKQEAAVFERMPKISILVPLWNTPESFLTEMIGSVQWQTYKNWELCLADGSDDAHAYVGEYCKRLAAQDSRIVYQKLAKNEGISGNTNECYKLASGEFIGLFDHDDILHPCALYEYVKAINEKDADFIYCDEATFKSPDINKMITMHFKPDYAIDNLRANNYICHFSVFSRELLDGTELFRTKFDGSQDHDMILRLTAKAKLVYHVPKLLYYWRSHAGSVAGNIEAKPYVVEAARGAVADHLRRHGFKNFTITSTRAFETIFKISYEIIGEPKISIIIPNKDHIDDLKRCMNSIEQKSTYKNYEYIIVENNSTDSATFEYYKKLEAENPKVRMVYWDGVFNYSAINNYGASFAKGEYLLLLNNDTEIINPDCLEELLGYCMRKDVGAVGARLYYEDDTIQHAGVVIGFGGIAGHCFVQQKRGTTGYCHRIICAQDYSAVTAACMMVKKSAFDAVGGLSEELAVAFNDIDFCMKLRKAGYLIVYNPYAELYHYESKSRGLEDTPEKVARFNKEIATFEKKWPEILKNGDPYYNPNLTLKSQDFSLKRI